MVETHYNKLLIWQKAMSIVDDVYFLTKELPKEELYGLTSQMRRAAVSIPSNIAEGSQRNSQKEFAKFILIAKGSLSELETQLLVCFRQKIARSTLVESLLEKTDELGRMLYSFHSSIRSRISRLESHISS